jgi:iron complex outermembrane receptor protein
MNPNPCYPALVVSNAASRSVAWLSFLVMTLALCASFTTAHAQSAAVGTVQGRVLNAANGTYLDKAVVSVEGTNLQTLTNGFGEFVLKDVPAGSVKIRVTYTGQPAQTATVTVPAGASVLQDVALGGTTGLGAESTVLLNPFVVETERYKNAQQLAINEERRSVNIKNVVAADQFGDIPEGNIGEFIKFLPGVEINYGGAYTSDADATGISVRGFGAEDTQIFIDGVPVSSASPASLSRAVGLDQLSINNASRVELIKVPTPDMPSNSVGGAINLISKSAFEYAHPTFTWRLFASMNTDDPKLFSKVGGPRAKKEIATQPGLDLTYARPVSKTFGYTITFSSSNQFNESRRFRPEWGVTSVTNVDLRPLGGSQTATLANSVGPASLANPYMTRISVTDAPRFSDRLSGSIKTDWRPFPSLTLSGSYTGSFYNSADAARRLQFRIQRPQTWDANSTISYPFVQAAQSQQAGATFNPNSTLDMNIDSRDKIGHTHTGYFNFKFNRGRWNVVGSASASTSRGSYKDTEHGHFSTVDVTSTIGKMSFEGIADGVPAKVTVLDRNNNNFDWTQLSNWVVPTLQARSGRAESLNDEFQYKLDGQRSFGSLFGDRLTLAAKAGVSRNVSVQKKWGLGTGWRQTYVGPAITTTDYLDRTYVGYSPGYIFPPQQWASTYRLYDIYKANPTYFNANSDADQVNNWNSTVNQNKQFKDTYDAAYIMFEGQTLNNRLNFITGVRQEQSKRTGKGPLLDSKWNYLKQVNGELYRDSAHPIGVRIDQAASDLFAQTTAGTALRSALTSAKIAYPDHVVLNTALEGAMLNRRILQAVHAENKGTPAPSVITSYNITENLVGKLSWSRTFGRINFEDGAVGGLISQSNQFSINETDTVGAVPAGTISVANPNLPPQISDNWDYSLYYYTKSGGKIGSTYFTKSIKNFQDTFTITSADPTFATVLDSIGLNAADFQDWNLTTSEPGNGTGKASGYEFDMSQDLRFLPFIGNTWGREINFFGTFSNKRRAQTNTTRLTAKPSANRLATAGLQFAHKGVSLLLKATWSDIKFISSTNVAYNGVTYPVGTYTPSITKVDASFNWQFSKKYGFFASGRDILNNGNKQVRFDPANITPAYARWDDFREFGVQVNFGIKGTF